jgi:HK97 family phage major capsid protein
MISMGYYEQEAIRLYKKQQKILNLAAEEDRDLTTEEEDECLQIERDLESAVRMAEPHSSPLYARSDNLKYEFCNGDTFETRFNRATKGENKGMQLEYQTNKKLNDEYRAIGEHFKGEARTLQKDKDVKGGYLVMPEQTQAKIWKDLDSIVHIRQHATIFNVDKADSVGIPTLDSDLEDPDWTGEITESQLSDAGYGKRSLHPHRLVKGTKYSRDLKRLSAPDFANHIIDRGTYKLGVAQEKGFMTGSGAAGRPLGIFTVSDQGVSSNRDVSTGNTQTAVKADGLINCYYGLAPQYHGRQTLRWLFHPDTTKMIRLLKTSDGQYLWQNGLVADEPPRILGVKVLVSNFAPNTFSAGERVGCLCDLSFYGIAQHPSISVQILYEKYALENSEAAIFMAHVDGAPIIENAFSMVTLAS